MAGTAMSDFAPDNGMSKARLRRDPRIRIRPYYRQQRNQDDRAHLHDTVAPLRHHRRRTFELKRNDDGDQRAQHQNADLLEFLRRTRAAGAGHSRTLSQILHITFVVTAAIRDSINSVR